MSYFENDDSDSCNISPNTAGLYDHSFNSACDIKKYIWGYFELKSQHSEM